MKTKSYIFAGIIAAITMGNAYADKGDPGENGEHTVTSKSYVDAMDALKQNKIPATGTNASTPGDTVVTYTDTAGTIGERGIYNGGSQYNDSADSGKLVTAGTIFSNFQSDSVVKKVCANSPDCTLWELQEVVVHKLQCQTAADCANISCAKPSGTGMSLQIVSCNACINHVCRYVESTGGGPK